MFALRAFRVPRPHPVYPRYQTSSRLPRRHAPRLLTGLAGVLSLAALAAPTSGRAQDVALGDLSDSAQQQIAEILAVKDTFSPAERKIASELVFAGRKARGLVVGPVADGIISLKTVAGTDNAVRVDVGGKVNGKLRAAVAANGGSVDGFSKAAGRMTATVPLSALETLAADPNVAFIRRPSLRTTNVGSLTSQGYISHSVRQAINQTGFNGSGVKVGVLSDSASPARVAALVASGDLGPNTVVLDAGDPGSDEGTAMMEIIQDMAPGAQLYFATAFRSDTSFADNIRALAAVGCTIIVDDITYFDEGVFQDGVIARAVNDVTALGALYFSSAGNSGNAAHGTSGTWEGDFTSGGAYPGPVPTGDAKSYQVHRFQTTPAAQNYDVVTGNSGFISLKWSDPLGGSTNDYDLFVLDATGTTVKGFSVDVQNGTQDPLEEVAGPGFGGTNYPNPVAGDRLVLVKTTAAATRALHVDTERGSLSIGTNGNTFGHNAAANTVCLAATYWNSARTGTKPFNGTNNPAETFSSDGPRKVFYNPDGSPIISGNFLFGTNGGTTLQKPNLTAADGNVCLTPGFSPFFGTSAAAPHAAGIAALIKSARPNLTNAQLLGILQSSALDNEAAGPDPTGGYGVISALAAMQAALATPAP